jgi:hypothetical protein
MDDYENEGLDPFFVNSPEWLGGFKSNGFSWLHHEQHPSIYSTGINTKDLVPLTTIYHI